MGYYLVTGGAGFIGSHIVEALVSLGKKVRVLDDFSTGRKEYLEPFLDKIDIVKGDIRSREIISRAIRDVDYVFHLAANHAVLKSIEYPMETHEVNVTGTLNLLLAAKGEKVKRFVFASSSAAYGNANIFPSRENDPIHPESPYGSSKILAEEYCRLFSEVFGLDTVSLRYFNVYGPRQHAESRYSAVIPVFVDCLLSGKAPEIHWDGKQSRDFVYVKDVVQANLAAIRGPEQGGAVFNIASGRGHSVLEIYEILARELGINGIKPYFGPKRPGDVRRSVADIRKAKNAFGYKVNVPFEKGIKKTIQWFIQNRMSKKR